MGELVSTQVIVGLTRNAPAEEDVLDRLADACLTALNSDGRFIAFGPVVSVDYTKPSIDVECTVCTETGTDDEVEAKMNAISEIMSRAIVEAEYATSAERISAVPA